MLGLLAPIFLFCAQQDPEVVKLQPAIDKAIDRGVAYLLMTQERDGSWGDWWDRSRSGQTALAVYTLMKAGLPVDHPSVRQGLTNMSHATPDRTYGLACHLLALEAAGDKSHVKAMLPILATLLDAQNGSWGYIKGGRPDISNTQYAALGLRAAQQAKLKVPPEAWRRLIAATLKYQEPRRWVDMPATGKTGKMAVAAFSYEEGKSQHWGSMTAAGVGILVMCREGLGKRLTKREAADIDASIQLGLNWLNEHFVVNDNPLRPGLDRWLGYYLYGLERIGSLLEIERIGEHAWYLEGARELIKRQGGDGGWREVGSQAETCFAILFLKRATRVATGGVSNRKKKLYVSEDPDSGVGLRALGDSPLEIWISGFGLFTRQVYASGLMIDRVEYTVDGNVVQTVKGNPKKAWAQERFLIRHTFDQRGNHRIGVRVHLAGDDAAVLVAQPLTVRITEAVEPWMERAANAHKLNLLTGRSVAVRTSSTNIASQMGKFAVDGLQATFWACSNADKAPWIALRLSDPIKANTIVLSQAFGQPTRLGQLDLIRKVEIRINGKKKPYIFELDPYELRPTKYALPKVMSIRRLEIQIKERKTGRVHKRIAGFAEIGLENRRKGKSEATPWLPRQRADGSIHFRGSDVTIHGDVLNTYPDEGTVMLGFWTVMSEWLSWDFQVDEPGSFRVELEYACDPGAFGSVFAIAVGDQSVTGEIKSTGSWFTFTTADLGTMKVTKKGLQTLSVKATHMPRGAVMNLRSVTLTPVK